MKGCRVLYFVLATLFPAAPAWAHHWVFVDFSAFDLSAWPSVNGHTPPTQNDLTAIQQQILANMATDYAPFDVHFTTNAPPNGRFTRVAIFGVPGRGGLLGCAGFGCCAFGNCTGIGSFGNAQSGCEVYAGSFASDSNFSAANATTARIANGISHTASHELGHVLGLFHCHAADDFVSSGALCLDGFQDTADDNVNFHVMASGASSGLSMSQRATRERFFSVHSERRVLFKNFQVRNHWSPLGNINAGGGLADLVYGGIVSPNTVGWNNRLSDGSSFGALTTWEEDAGDAGDVFLLGDVNGGGRDDLVVGKSISANVMRWTVHRSLGGSALEAPTVFAIDAGNVGNIFRLADLDGDGRKDLLRGIVDSSSTVRWVVHRSTGTAFEAGSTVSSDAGDAGDLFLVGDVTGNGLDDLMVVGRGAVTRTEVHRSTGTTLVPAGTDVHLAFDPDYVMLGDVDADGRADLVTGRVLSDRRVDWDVRKSNGCTGLLGNCLDSVIGFRDNAGDAGDLFRLGDGNGGGRADLFYGRMVGMNSLTTAPDLSLMAWFGRLSTGSSFGDVTTWRGDAGAEGAIVP
jgi:hypothetical protein